MQALDCLVKIKNMNTLPSPDFSDVAYLVPEIDFPHDLSDLELVKQASLQAYTQAKKCEEFLSDSLRLFYPPKAAILFDLVGVVSGLWTRGILFWGEGEFSAVQYTKIESAYFDLRNFVLSLGSLEEDDFYSEEGGEQ